MTEERIGPILAASVHNIGSRARRSGLETSQDARERQFSDEFIDQALLTLSDMARGIEPRTVLHALLEERSRGMSLPEIIAETGLPAFQAERDVARLWAEGWILDYDEDGQHKFIVRGAVRKPWAGT